MGHSISAFIGNDKTIRNLAETWLRKPLILSQGISMLYLDDNLFDDITELANVDNNLPFKEFDYLTTAVILVLEEYSKNTLLSYVETEYFGGVGCQSAILYENGKVKISPIKTNDMESWVLKDNKRAINIVLKELGVYKVNGKDEFDSIGLGNFRDMYF